MTTLTAAQTIHADLQSWFPTTEFTVIPKKYVGSVSGVRVLWTDGATAKQVEAVVRKYENAKFIVEVSRDFSLSAFLNMAQTVANNMGIKLPKINVSKDGSIPYIALADDTLGMGINRESLFELIHVELRKTELSDRIPKVLPENFIDPLTGEGIHGWYQAYEDIGLEALINPLSRKATLIFAKTPMKPVRALLEVGGFAALDDKPVWQRSLVGGDQAAIERLIAQLI